RDLVGRPVELVRRPRREPERSDVADDPDHRPVLVDVGSLSETLADGIFVRPELLRHRLVDENRAGALAVAAVERPATQQGNPERLQVVAVEIAILDERILVRAPGIASLARLLAVVAEAVHRQMADEAGVLHAADLRQPFVERAIERRDGVELRITRSRRID